MVLQGREPTLVVGVGHLNPAVLLDGLANGSGSFPIIRDHTSSLWHMAGSHNLDEEAGSPKGGFKHPYFSVSSSVEADNTAAHTPSL